MSVNRFRLKHLAKKGNKGAVLASKLLDETDKLLSVILLCNNFCNAAAATLVTIIAVQLYGEDEAIIMSGTIITTFLILIFSEISPKVIAAAHAEKLALLCSFVLFPLLKILYPIVWFVNIFVLSILKIFNIKINFTQNNLITMDELKSIISESGQFIPNKNKSIFLNLIDLEKITVEDIMMPHTNIESLNIGQPVEDILNKLSNSHNQSILFKKIDNESIHGVLETHKILKLLIKSKDGAISKEHVIELIDQPYFIPSGTSLYKQIQYFQDNQEKLAYSKWAWWVYWSGYPWDILEEIVGEFNVELPSKLSKITFDTDGWIVDGSITLRTLNKKMKMSLPVNGPKTLNGLITEFFEEIPDPNTSFKLHGRTMEIISAQDKTVKTVKIFKQK